MPGAFVCWSLDPLSRPAQRDLENPVSRARLEHLQAHAHHGSGCLGNRAACLTGFSPVMRGIG
jgi:hypothetical protein